MYFLLLCVYAAPMESLLAMQHPRPVLNSASMTLGHSTSVSNLSGAPLSNSLLTKTQSRTNLADHTKRSIDEPVPSVGKKIKLTQSSSSANIAGGVAAGRPSTGGGLASSASSSSLTALDGPTPSISRDPSSSNLLGFMPKPEVVVPVMVAGADALTIPRESLQEAMQSVFDKFWSYDFVDTTVKTMFRNRISQANCKQVGLQTFAEEALSLRVIQERLGKNFYNNALEFQNDFRLMFHNLFTYFPPDSAVYMKAQELSEMFESLWAECKRKYGR